MNQSDSTESDTDLNRLIQMVTRHSKEFENLIVSQSQSQSQQQQLLQQQQQQQQQDQQQKQMIYMNQVDNKKK